MKNIINKFAKGIIPLVVTGGLFFGSLFNGYGQDTVKTDNGYEVYQKTNSSDKKDHGNHAHVVSQNYDNIQKYDNQDKLVKEVCVLKKNGWKHSIYTRLFEYDNEGKVTKDVTIWDENGDGKIKGRKDTKITWIHTYDSMVKFNKKGKVKKAVLISAL